MASTAEMIRSTLYDFDLSDPYACRQAIRAGKAPGVTTNMAPGHVQGNLAILPAEHAEDFLRFCMRNPKPCPLLDVSDRGDPMMPRLGRDLDIRTDISSYRVWRDGELVEEIPSIEHLWRDDLVAFVLGCSISFEKAMLDAQLPLRHVERGVDVPMYVTNIETAPSGPFRGGMVVGMRPFKPADAIRAIQITTRFPTVHGAPVHIGRPDLIGINDLNNQQFGAAPDIRDDEIPVFWACGVTPQNIIRHAKPSLCITHSPSHMLVCDAVSATQATL